MTFKSEKFKDIIQYYDETRFDYHVAWLNDDNLAVHFGFYDESSNKHSDALANTNRVLAELAKIKAGQKVLDAGCGKGGSAFWLAGNKKAEVIGITPVPSQIADCNAAAQSWKFNGQVTFVQADYCDTPFENNFFDVIWACESVCHASRKIDFYKEAFRLLKPGGRLVMAEYMRFERLLPDVKEKLLAAWLLRWAIPDIDTSIEHFENAEKVGFQTVEIQDFTKYARVSLRNLHETSKRWITLGRILRMLGIRSKIQHDNHVGSIHLYRALQQGLWFYGVMTAEKPRWNRTRLLKQKVGTKNVT